MDESFQQRLNRVTDLFEQLVSSSAFRLPIGRVTLPQKGIYLFSENGRHLYVGRSDNIRRRLGLHTRPKSDYFQASFATLLAKEESQLVADYRHRRIDPLHFANQQTFREAFLTSKLRVKAMEIRVIEEADAVNQALLEVYTAVVLPTKYNDFSNH